MRIIKNTLRWIRIIFSFCLFILIDYFWWMIRYARNKDKYPFSLRFKRVSAIMRRGIKAFGIKLYVEGQENIPDTASYFVSNHQGAVDPVIYFGGIGIPFSFVAKKEVAKIPFVGKCCKCIDSVFLPREDLKKSLKLMLQIEKSLTEKKHHWMIFAEGTRNRDPLSNTLEMHHGSFRPAMKAKAPIVPCCIYGTFRLLMSKPVFDHYPVQIKFLKPLMPEEYENLSTEEVAKIIRDRIATEVSYNMVKKDNELMIELGNEFNPYFLGHTI